MKRNAAKKAPAKKAKPKPPIWHRFSLDDRRCLMLDGKRVKGVRSCSLTVDADRIAILQLELFVRGPSR